MTESEAERAAIMEFDGGVSRRRAEYLAGLAGDYYAHHWSCTECRNGTSASSGTHRMCHKGKILWNRYDRETRG